MENIKLSGNELIGNTPLLELRKFENKYKISNNRIVAKLEYFNLAGSVKDRIALQMIEDAEKNGEISKGGVIIETTSGNTGVGLAAVATIKGYKVIIIMPDNMSIERSKLLRAYGAEVILTEGSKGMQGAIDKAEELTKQIPNSIIMKQFFNISNAKAHKLTTGPEIWRDTDGKVDIFVSGVGTGGTITGVGEYLKEKNPNIKIVAVEPENSAVLSGGKPGPHKIQGIGAGFIPKVLNVDIFDEVITVSDEDAFSMAREAATLEGILVGISSGASLYAAKELANREENKGKTIVVLLADGGERYLSTPLFIKE